MKDYLNALRWCIWAAVLLPLIYYASYAIPQLFLLSTQWIYFIAYIALFIWAGVKASRASYSVIHSAFAGTVLLFVSQIVSTPLRFVFATTAAAVETRPLWGVAVHSCLQAILIFCLCFPIALGVSALGAYLNTKKSRGQSTSFSQP